MRSAILPTFLSLHAIKDGSQSRHESETNRTPGKSIMFDPQPPSLLSVIEVGIRSSNQTKPTAGFQEWKTNLNLCVM